MALSGGGQVLEGYELVEVIGRGSTGKVWKARQHGSDRVVALKILHLDLVDDPEVQQRFTAEAHALSGRQFPGVVPVLGMLQTGEQLVLVMELVDGPNLRQWLAQRGPLTPTEACELSAQIASALSAAHDSRIVHRDLKPENVLIDEHDDKPVALVTDFGLARLAEGTALTRTSRFVGTPDYVAPEVLSGDRASPAADVYALGVILFEMLTGWRPFRGATIAAVLTQHLNAAAARPSGVPAPLWNLLDRVLAKAPEQRPTARELSESLPALAVELVEAPARKRSEPPPPSAMSVEEVQTRIRTGRPSAAATVEARPMHNRRKAIAAVVAGSSLLLIAAGTVLSQTRNEPESQQSTQALAHPNVDRRPSADNAGPSNGPRETTQRHTSRRRLAQSRRGPVAGRVQDGKARASGASGRISTAPGNAEGSKAEPLEGSGVTTDAAVQGTEQRRARARPQAAGKGEGTRAASQEAARQKAARQDRARQKAARQKAARQEAARQEAARQTAARQEAARQERARQEAARREAARQELVRQEAARVDGKSPWQQTGCANSNTETLSSANITASTGEVAGTVSLVWAKSCEAVFARLDYAGDKSRTAHLTLYRGGAIADDDNSPELRRFASTNMEYLQPGTCVAARGDLGYLTGTGRYPAVTIEHCF